MTEKVYVKKSRLGLAVFAKQDIKQGEKILEFEGSVAHPDITTLQGPEYEADCFQIAEKDDPKAYLNLTESGRSINHSCDPNSGVINNTELIALRDIDKNKEITYDYSTTMDEDYWTMKCECNSKNCRKIIKDFKHLPKNIQQKYLELGIVQDFIAKKYKK